MLSPTLPPRGPSAASAARPSASSYVLHSPRAPPQALRPQSDSPASFARQLPQARPVEISAPQARAVSRPSSGGASASGGASPGLGAASPQAFAHLGQTRSAATGHESREAQPRASHSAGYMPPERSATACHESREVPGPTLPRDRPDRPALPSPGAGGVSRDAGDPSVSIVACKDGGQILRRVDPKTGEAKTLVTLKDGSRSVFGTNTVTSLVSGTEQRAVEWIGAMVDLEFRGLLHQMTFCLVEGSQRYHKRCAELESLAGRMHFAFFGLPEDASVRDLDNVYRRKAREMHPDKNGGTEEAKRMFQDMKEKYEELRQRLLSENMKNREAGLDQPGENVQAGEHENDMITLNKENREGINKAEDVNLSEGHRGTFEKQQEPQPDNGHEQGDDPQNIRCDSEDRRDLEKSFWRMMKQLKNINNNEVILDAEFQRIRKVVAGTSGS